MIVGAYRTSAPDEAARIQEYSPSFNPERFTEHDAGVRSTLLRPPATVVGSRFAVTTGFLRARHSLRAPAAVVRSHLFGRILHRVVALARWSAHASSPRRIPHSNQEAHPGTADTPTTAFPHANRRQSGLGAAAGRIRRHNRVPTIAERDAGDSAT